MAEPQRASNYDGFETQDELFARETYGGGIPTKPVPKPERFQIQNAQKNAYVPKQSPTPTAANQNEPIVKKKAVVARAIPKTNKYVAAEGNPVMRTSKKLLPPLRKKVSFFRGASIGVLSFGWTFNLWLFFQLPLAICTLGALGIWYYAETVRTTFLGQIVEGAVTVATEIGNALGIIEVNLLNFSSLFFVFWVLTIISGLIAVLGVVLHSLISFLHPLGGEGTAFKGTVLFLALIGYIVPGLNLFPWIWVYLPVLMRYPK